jgi:integrase
MRKALTDTFLRALKKPAKGRLEYADIGCRGLEFRITQAGARSWSYRYRAPVTGKLSRATIGPYPTISLADARLKADDLRKGVAGGENPSESKRRAKREAPGRTFKALADRYMKEYARRPYGKRLHPKRSADQDERNLKLHVLPFKGVDGERWQDRDYGKIRRADVIQLVESLIAAGTETLANRVQSLISGVFSFAVDSDLIDANPCTRLKKRGRERVGNRVLTDPEIRLFWSKAIREPISPATGAALHLELLTGVRPGEVAGIWRSELEYLDQPGKAVWTVPGERTKNKLPHMVPLESAALEIINARIAAAAGNRKNDFPIFPARNKPDKAMTAHALARAMSRLAEKLTGVAAGAKSWKADRPTPHDLRRTFRTRLPQIGVPADIRDRLMNHIPSDVGSKHYDRYQYLDEKREALLSWQVALADILKGDGRPRTGAIR